MRSPNSRQLFAGIFISSLTVEKFALPNQTNDHRAPRVDALIPVGELVPLFVRATDSGGASRLRFELGGKPSVPGRGSRSLK